MEARRVLVSGRVQGVGFRAFVARRARELGVSGFVRNLDDGRVEAVCAGEAAQVQALTEACRAGPPHARVAHLDIAVVPALDLPRHFEIRPDGAGA